MQIEISRGAIVLWLLRHSAEIPGVIPLLRDAADYGGLEETVDDAIGLLQWFKPIAHDFPGDAGTVTTLSDEQEANALALFGGRGEKLKKLIDALGGIAGIIEIIRSISS